MKKQFLKYIAATAIVFAVVIVACNKKTETEQSPSIVKKDIQRKAGIACPSSEELNEVFRSKIGDGSVIEMVITKDVAGMVTVTTTPTATLPSDRSSFWMYDASMSETELRVNIPNDDKKYWMVYFDGTQSPALVSGGGSVTYTCDCNIEGTAGCDVTLTDCKADCSLGGACSTAGSGCCLESDKGSGGIIRSGAVLLEAVSINFNGIAY